MRANERIIAGAYVDERGGVCPMLAAHRRGGRTDFLSFARSWDRFTRARGSARAATEREVRILVGQLQDSLEQASGLELDARSPSTARWRGAPRARARRRDADPPARSGEPPTPAAAAPHALRRRSSAPERRRREPAGTPA